MTGIFSQRPLSGVDIGRIRHIGYRNAQELRLKLWYFAFSPEGRSRGFACEVVMSQTVPELLVDALERIAVRHIFGLIGDSLNPLAAAVRRTGVVWDAV